MIEIHQLRKAYGKRVILSVDRCSLRGSNVVLQGENGVGKTTLLLMLAGLEHPNSGGIEI